MTYLVSKMKCLTSNLMLKRGRYCVYKWLKGLQADTLSSVLSSLMHGQSSQLVFKVNVGRYSNILMLGKRA